MNVKNRLPDTHKYDDIIALPHHVSENHPQMPLLSRAAQFSPFAALTGYDAAIHEAARVTQAFAEPGQDRKEQLDRQLFLIREDLSRQPASMRPEIQVVYFQPDSRKDGGAYVTFKGQVKRIDDCRRQLIFMDGTALPLENLFSITGELFRDLDNTDA